MFPLILWKIGRIGRTEGVKVTYNRTTHVGESGERHVIYTCMYRCGYKNGNRSSGFLTCRNPLSLKRGSVYRIK